MYTSSDEGCNRTGKKEVSKLEQYGRVLKKLEGDKVLVDIRRHHACRKCGACGNAAGQKSLVEARDPLGVSRGAEVRLETGTREVLLSAFLLYIVPLAGLLIGLFTGRYLVLSLQINVHPEIAGVVMGLFLMVFVYVYLRRQDPGLKSSGRFDIVITGVSEEEREKDSGFNEAGGKSG